MGTDDDESLRLAIDRGSGDVNADAESEDEMAEIRLRARAALLSGDKGFSREESIMRARAAVDALRSGKR